MSATANTNAWHLRDRITFGLAVLGAVLGIVLGVVQIWTGGLIGPDST